MEITNSSEYRPHSKIECEIGNGLARCHILSEALQQWDGVCAKHLCVDVSVWMNITKDDNGSVDDR